GGFHSRLDLCEQAGEVAEFDAIDSALCRAAGRVAHHQDDLRADDLTGVLDASEDVVVGDVAGHARVEHVADAEVHDRFGGRAGVDAAQEGRGRILSFRACSLLGQVVLRRPLAFSEALVTTLHQLDDLVRRHAVALRLGQCGRPRDPARERGPNERNSASQARSLEECAAVDTLRITHVGPPDRALSLRRKHNKRSFLRRFPGTASRRTAGEVLPEHTNADRARRLALSSAARLIRGAAQPLPQPAPQMEEPVGHRADGFLGLDRCAARGAEGGPISHTVIMGYDAARETGKSFLMPSAHGQPRWSHVDFVLVSRINRQDTSPLVLVVDDSAATRELYSTYLRAQGLRVLVATDGAIGVRMAVASRPDVIV